MQLSWNLIYVAEGTIGGGYCLTFGPGNQSLHIYPLLISCQQGPPVFLPIAETTWTAFYPVGSGSTGVGTTVNAKNLMLLNSQSMELWALKPSPEDTVDIMRSSCIIFHLFQILEGYRANEVIVSHVFESHWCVRNGF